MRPIAVTEDQLVGLDGLASALPVSNVDDSALVVAISGDTLVVGAPFDDRDKSGQLDSQHAIQDVGSAYVFVRSDAGWQKQAVLKASNAGADDYFGRAVAIDGDTIVVGADGESSSGQGVNAAQTHDGATNCGAAYVFVRTGTKWSQQAYLKASNGSSYHYFGESLAVSGDTVVVGAHGESADENGVGGEGFGASGAAYVFQRAGQIWQEDAYLKAKYVHEDDWFGARVAIFKDTVAVTAPGDNGGASGVNGAFSEYGTSTGAVYTFKHTDFGWFEEAYIKPPNYHLDADFGRGLALGDGVLVVGTPGDRSRARYVDGDEFDTPGDPSVVADLDTSISENGSVYVFERIENVSPIGDPPPPWHQTAYLKAANSDGKDAFGKSVSLNGDYLVVGAPGESSSLATDPTDNLAARSGAAYLFHRTGSSWSQTSYIKPSNLAAEVGFGCSLGLAANRIAVGNCGHLDPSFWTDAHFGKAATFQF